MLKKIRLLFVAAFAALAIIGVSADAHAIGNNTTGNIVQNASNSTGNVYIYYGSTGQYSTWLYVGQDSDSYEHYNVQCFYPTKDSHSQWGGLYKAFVTRCFTTNYNYLILHVGR